MQQTVTAADDPLCAYCGEPKEKCRGEVMLLKRGGTMACRHMFKPWRKEPGCECDPEHWQPWQRVQPSQSNLRYGEICECFAEDVHNGNRRWDDRCEWCGHLRACHTVQEEKVELPHESVNGLVWS